MLSSMLSVDLSVVLGSLPLPFGKRSRGLWTLEGVCGQKLIQKMAVGSQYFMVYGYDKEEEL